MLAVGHVLIMHVVDEGVGRVDFGVRRDRGGRARSGGPGTGCSWSLALVHGINGLRIITLDYVRRPGVRLTINMVFYVLGFALFVLGLRDRLHVRSVEVAGIGLR